MKKGLLGIFAACAIGFSTILPIEAVYRPSVVMNAEPSGQTASIVNSSGQPVNLEVVEPGSYAGLIDDLPGPVIQVTPVTRTLRFRESATGLTEKGNELTNVVYDAVTKSEDTRSLLDKLHPSAEKAFRQAMKNGKSFDDYEPLSLFDVTANDEAIRQMEGGKIEVDVKMDGIKKGDEDDLIALHFHADPDQVDLQQLQDSENIKEVFSDISVLNHKIDQDNVLTLEMDRFSPVLIFKTTDSNIQIPDKKTSPDTGI